MTFSTNDNEAPWQVRQMIDITVAEWLNSRPAALSIPIADPTLGEFAVLLRHASSRLV